MKPKKCTCGNKYAGYISIFKRNRQSRQLPNLMTGCKECGKVEVLEEGIL